MLLPPLLFAVLARAPSMRRRMLTGPTGPPPRSTTTGGALPPPLHPHASCPPAETRDAVALRP
jgi:hypothetical protein